MKTSYAKTGRIFPRSPYFVHGGDYDKFTRKIVEFFNILKSCKIEPYIILDGGYEPDNFSCELVIISTMYKVYIVTVIQ
jgi:hypothetical protein